MSINALKLVRRTRRYNARWSISFLKARRAEVQIALKNAKSRAAVTPP
jgi:hypothetical protein